MGYATMAAGQKILEDTLVETIKKAMTDRGMNMDKVAAEALMSRPTLYKRLSCPSSLRMDELYRISYVLGIKFWIKEDKTA